MGNGIRPQRLLGNFNGSMGKFLACADSVRQCADLGAVRLVKENSDTRDLKNFFGEDAERLVAFTLSHTLRNALMAQRAVRALLADWRIVCTKRYSYNGKDLLVERLAVQVGREEYEFIVEAGVQYWESAEGARMVIRYLVVNHRAPGTFYEMQFLLPESRHCWLRDLIRRMEAWTDEHHFYRGQTIDAVGEFIRFEEETAWENVILPDSIRKTLERNCLDLLRHRELYRANGLPLKRGILLYGKPGTGKTMIGRALAQRCGVTFIVATPGLLSRSDDVRRVFSWGRRFAPTILFFEDLDMVAAGRHSGETAKEILGEFLAGLDGLDSGEGVITIATTNDLAAIEPALKDRPNRFDVVLEIPPMDDCEPRVFLERWTSKHSQNGLDVENVVGRSDGFTGAQMQELCRLAVMEAVEEHVSAGLDGSARLPLCAEHFNLALARCNGKPRKAMGFV